MSNFTQQITTDLTVMANLFLDALYPAVKMIPRIQTAVPVLGSDQGDEILISDISVAGAPATRAINGAATASDLVTLTKSMPRQNIYWGFKIDNLEQFFAPRAFNLRQKGSVQLAKGIAAQLDANVLSNAAYQAGYSVGKVDGGAVWNSTDLLKPLNDALSKFEKNGVEGDFHAIFGPTEANNYRATPNLFKANEAGSSDLLRRGILGSIFGFEVLASSQVLTNFTPSVAAETATPGAVVGVNAQGAATLAVNGLGSGSVKKGTIFTIAGFTNKGGYLVGFTVTADTAISANAATLPIFPKLPAATVGSEVVAFTEHSAAGSANLAWETDAILAYIEAPPPMVTLPSVRVVDPDSGIGVRLTVKENLLGTSGNAMNMEVVADVMFGTLVGRPEGVVRIGGAV